MSMPTGGPPDPDGLFFPVLYLRWEDGDTIGRASVAVETRRGVRGSRSVAAICIDGEWFHLLPKEQSLWISMLDGRIVGIVD